MKTLKQLIVIGFFGLLIGAAVSGNTNEIKRVRGQCGFQHSRRDCVATQDIDGNAVAGPRFQQRRGDVVT